MPSPAEPRRIARLGFERGTRVAAIGLLAWLLLRAVLGRAAPVEHRVAAPELAAGLTRWSTVGEPSGVHLRLAGGISPHQRDWLRALSGAGTRVTWEGEGSRPIALVAEPVADPAGGTTAWIAAPDGAPVILEDAVGRLDSLSVQGGGGRVLVRSGPRLLRVRVGRSEAESLVADSLVFGRVFLMGRAGWESKFVAAALEERGWSADARFLLSPRGDVVQGSPAPIDPARYSVVLVLDSIGTRDAERVLAFARAGGGVILGPAASALPVFSPIAAGLPGAGLPGREPFDPAAPEPRRSLELFPVQTRVDAVVLERRDRLPAVAARRIERGRVATIGYAETWRWRMGGAGDAAGAHRDWWADLVASVARVGRVPAASADQGDEAPLVSLIERLGTPSTAPTDRPEGGISDSWLFALLGFALLLEWSSRRLRGVP